MSPDFDAFTLETNEDLKWFKNEKGRICVRFPGLAQHVFQIFCDRRQIHWFQRFLDDQETKQASQGQHTSSLFTLRSAQLIWQEGEGKGEPWQVNRLALHVTVDTRLWTVEGTEQVRQEKAAQIVKILDSLRAKNNLTKTQQNYEQRLNSTLTRMDQPFERPSKPLYQGQSHILLGVSLGLKQPATVVVVNGSTSEVLASRNIRQLLGENYRLLNRQRRMQQKNSHERSKAQRRNSPSQFSESNLGEYVDRLIAKAIIKLAMTHGAASIALPRMEDMREIVQTELQAAAEQEFPSNIELQSEYAKQYRTSIHRWSYGRLIDSIRSKAAQAGIVIEQGKQPYQGSQHEKAVKMGIAVYQARQENCE